MPHRPPSPLTCGETEAYRGKGCFYNSASQQPVSRPRPRFLTPHCVRTRAQIGGGISTLGSQAPVSFQRLWGHKKRLHVPGPHLRNSLGGVFVEGMGDPEPHWLPRSQNQGVRLPGHVLCPPWGSGSQPLRSINSNSHIFLLSCALRGFLETLGKEAPLDWMETP